MTFVVHHSITDTEAFWNVLASNPAIPEGFALCSVLPGMNPSEATCIWKAASKQSLEALVNDTTGNYSNNSFMEVNEEKAFGLPS
jgi:hypothetical protein